MKRVLITGCGGMLGSAIYPAFAERYEVLATDRILSEPWLNFLNVNADSSMVFDQFRPDLVLHLAAETDLEFCESYPDIAKETNANATRAIATLASRYNSTLVYVSTAGVFDGRKTLPYTEDDEPNPINVYGRSKLAGENYVHYHRKHFVVRAGWMIGGGAKDHKFVSLIRQQIASGAKTICAVNDRFGSPTYTKDFAANLLRLLETKEYGMYHITCEGRPSRWDIAKEIALASGAQGIEVAPVSSEHFSKRYFAPRPRSEAMCNRNLDRLGINLMRPWQTALREYLGELGCISKVN